MKYWLFRCWLVCAALALVACDIRPTPQQNVGDAQWWSRGSSTEIATTTGRATEPVYRSPNDERQYRALTLENGLRVLLVSDPDTDKSAASLSVRVGSFQNPPEREGLAHFLEHMLFLGTEKYPEPGEYQAFIGAHGGAHNAYTSLEETNYFFDIDAAHLVPALDRFSQFFVAPRFDAAYVERERHAVESEYRLKIKDDSHRAWDVLRELVNPRHPLSQFSVGDLTTLADRPERPVRDDLVAFYRRYYSANLMTLVVVGRESLSELQAAVQTRFATIPNHNVTIASVATPLFTDTLPYKVLMTPEKEQRELSLLFPVPSVATYWREKPLTFLGYLLGDESADSLLAHLKREGLAESLSAGLAYDSRVGAGFSVTIGLTPTGVARHAEILTRFFAWAEQIRTQGVVPWRYRELAQLQQVEFRFVEKQPPLRYVQRLSSAMHDYPTHEAVRGPYLFDHYDAELIVRYLGYLVPGNVQIGLMAPEITATDRVSLRYGAPYRVVDVAPRDVAAWQNATTTALRLPEPNPFIPERFSLSEKKQKDDYLSVSADDVDRAAAPVDGQKTNPVALLAKPQLVRDDPRAEVWHYADNYFGSPKAGFSAQLVTPMATGRRNAALTELYLAMVRDQLNSRVYPAHLAGLDFGLSRTSNGITLTLEGYTDKQPLLLEEILAALRKPEADATRFARVKAMLIREWRNMDKQWPIRQLFTELPPQMTDAQRPQDLADALEPVSLVDLMDYVESFYRRGHGRFYGGGALARSEVESMVAAVLEALRIGAEGDASLDYRVVKLPRASATPRLSIPVQHADSSVVLYVQAETDSLRERAELAVLQNMLDAPFYTRLRTEKQLGYAVGSRIMPLHRVPGLLLYVQSPVAKSGPLMKEVDDFLDQFATTLESMSAAEIERHRQSVLTHVEEFPKSLAELIGRHQESLTLNYDDFAFRQMLGAEVRAATGENLLARYREVLLGKRRGLWLTTQDATLPDAGIGRDGLRAENDGYYRYPQ